MRLRISTKFILAGSALVLIALAYGACTQGGLRAVAGLIHNARMAGFVKSFDTSIDFYGRVLDQDDRPVEGAVVSVGIRHFSLISSYFVGSKNLVMTTGQDGLFEISDFRGSDLFIGGISREGYGYMLSQNPVNSFDYGGSTEPAFVPDKDNPVIFRIRKKLLNRTLLFENRHWTIQVLSENSGKVYRYDLVEQKWTQPPDKPSREKWSNQCDLRYGATLDETTGIWRVVFSACDPNGGVIASEKKLYEAPQEGYQSEWSFFPKVGRLPEKQYLYLKSRKPSIFGRIEIENVNFDNRILLIGTKVVTNPYGDRVLDSVDMDSLTSHQRVVLKKRLKSEAKAALREGRLPPRPKIMALIEAAKREEE